MDSKSPQFKQLDNIHHDLQGTFVLHQELMLCGKVKLSIKVLDLFVDLLSVHMRQEEEHLFPLIIRLLKMAPDRAVPLVGEHERLMIMIADFQKQIEDLVPLQGTELRRGLIGMLDAETEFKQLFLQHDESENGLLLPGLDLITENEERNSLIPQLVSEWDQAVSVGFPILKAAQAELMAWDRHQGIRALNQSEALDI